DPAAVTVVKRTTLLLLLLAVARDVRAQTRTFVSGTGLDTNPCTRTAPCLTFAHAFSVTASPGEIDVLDPGNFGSLNVNAKTLTVDGSAAGGGILATSGNGITVNPGAINPVVVIRGLSIKGGGTGSNGIAFVGGSELHVEDVVIDGFTTGIDFRPA